MQHKRFLLLLLALVAALVAAEMHVDHTEDEKELQAPKRGLKAMAILAVTAIIAALNLSSARVCPASPACCSGWYRALCSMFVHSPV
jgi:uncharacterized membrane protein